MRDRAATPLQRSSSSPAGRQPRHRALYRQPTHQALPAAQPLHAASLQTLGGGLPEPLQAGVVQGLRHHALGWLEAQPAGL